ncbi:hypothetical protein BB561_001241 [Smittium simulii]|uniref:tRNA:m(4)X modification enzyme TRM13 n=1 Tax=Smittium simulii TaxID=133385 RepID=A0A2T9YVH7_9FUNG|nr:hypothetical protein BB561_001241 [Smittium simulii]
MISEPKKNKRKEKPLMDFHCQFFVKHKNRFCRLIPKVGNPFCGEHAIQSAKTSESESSTQASCQTANKKVRVPCPYDTSHTVDLAKLEIHMKSKCNSRPKQTLEAYFLRDINMKVNQPTQETFLSSAIEKNDIISQTAKIMTGEGWSIGNAQLTVAPGELRYTSAFSALYGDLSNVIANKNNAAENLHESKELCDLPCNKKLKIADFSNSNNKPKSYLQSKLLFMDFNLLMEMVKNTVHTQIHQNKNSLNNDNISLMNFLSHGCQKEEFCNIDSFFNPEILSNDFNNQQECKKTNLKHTLQQSSLLGHLKKNNLLNPEYRYIEFGSGKGDLSKCVYEAMGEDSLKTKYILVDRKNFRKKWQGANQQQSINFGTNASTHSAVTEELKNSKIADSNGENKKLFDANTIRLQVDIRDLDLSGLSVLCKTPEGNQKNDISLADTTNDNNSKEYYPIVAYSKHLCGAATDLALNCLSNYEKKGGKVVGIVFALCCHHACKYSCYSNQDYLLRSLKASSTNPVSSINIHTPPESHSSLILEPQSKVTKVDRVDWDEELREYIKIISSLSSWATCGWKNSTMVESKVIDVAEPEDGNVKSITDKNDDHGVKSEVREILEQKYGKYMNLKATQEKVNVGKYCKRFFDFGRLEFVKSQLGMTESNLVIYTTSDISLENIALVAKR